MSPEPLADTDAALAEPAHIAVPRFVDVGARWSWRILVIAAAIVATGWLLARLRIVLIPVFVAVILAAVLTPLVDRLALRVPRLAALWAVLLGIAAATGALVWALEGSVRSSITDLSDSWGSTRQQIRTWLQDGPLGLSTDQVDRLSTEAGRARERFTSGLFDGGGDMARVAAEVIGGILLTLVLIVFFVKDGASMWTWFTQRLAAARRPVVDCGGRAAIQALRGWLRGVAITGLIDGILIGGALLILDVPAAIPLAVVTFFAAFFPIVGATLAGGLATLIALADQGPGTAVIVAVVVLVVQQVEGDVILPLIMQREVSLHPVVILLALAIGGAIGGVLGAVVSVPLTAAITAAVAAVRAEHGDLEPDPPPDDRASAPAT